MKQRQIDYYVSLEAAERAHRARDFQQSDGVQPMTMGWSRYRPHESRVIVRDMYGKEHWITPTQHKVLMAGRHLEGEKVTATIIANSLGVAVSSVTRALLRLAALKLIAYDMKRGRSGGITFLATAWADLKARSRQAWAKLQHERDKAYERYIRQLDMSHYFSAGLNFATTTT